MTEASHAQSKNPRNKGKKKHLASTPVVIDDAETFALEKRFSDLALPEPLLKALDKLKFERPTLIQASMIPSAIEGKDVLGQARTGTGKTAGFGLPALAIVEEGKPFSCLILVPTRELAIQVCDELRELAEFTKHRILPVYGGQRIAQQAEKLKKNPEIIVGTPGRVMDMNNRGLLPYNSIKLAILDEVDRMLDIGFRDDIRRILGKMSKDRQTIFVSATISGEIEKLARSYMRNPDKIVTTGKSLTVQQVAQSYLSVEPWDKPNLLTHLLKHEEPALTLVFCRTKRTVDKIQKKLERSGIDAHAIHGDMVQGRRNRVMRTLREGDLHVLVCSDLAARGLDVDGISHVINYDLPEDPEIYIHRVGRTARVGRDGIAWSFVSTDQGDLLTAIEMLANIEIPRKEFPDFKPGPVPSDVRAHRDHETAKKDREIKSKSRHTAPDQKDPADERMFPGGIVPKKMPPKRLMGRARTNRR
jgi:ATP-dependent RNA helicase DeaD